METNSDSVYFELSWSILSTIGVANVFFGVFVVSITNFSPIAAVPIVTSIAAAVANGLCYHAYYRPSQPLVNQAVASAFADILWMVRNPPDEPNRPTSLPPSPGYWMRSLVNYRRHIACGLPSFPPPGIVV